MSTPFAHALAGYTVIALAKPHLTRDHRSHAKALGAGFCFGALADADFLVAYFAENPELQHHYFSHAIPFVVLVGVMIYLALRIILRSRAFRLALVLTAAYGTHILLDYFTEDGSPPIGIPLFWPITHKHFIAPVNIFLSIHRGSMEALFGPHNFEALLRETIILGPIAVAAYLFGRKRMGARNGRPTS